MRWSDYQAWHHRNKPRPRVEDTMTDVMPTNLPVAPVAPVVNVRPTRDQLYPELVIASGVWRQHLRCGDNANCRRQQLQRVDLLLDEWLEATS